ncbi:MAG TPA: tetratricopeptide repeat protein [Thermoanaerobaculia bacterium]|nr:tetratricopeptide repeat protein [Thermoanaerobaculia bacterium]
MSQQSLALPSSFNVTCPGCGARLRFSVAEMPPRLRIQCSSCQTTFGVRRPGVEPAQSSASVSIGETPPTYLAFPVPTHPTSAGTASAVAASTRPHSMDEPAFPPEATIAGRYRVVRFIARGGMGEVYEVEDLELRERVALKTVRPEAARDTLAVERFRREIQLARKVTHPNVCRIFDVGSAAGTIFLTMELLPGETLSQRLRRAGPMPTEEALPVARQIADALHAAHQAGVVHRDLKPGNVVLVESRGAVGPIRAVVTDFGLARLESGLESPGQALTLTAAAAVVGTPAYLAPEQVEGSEITAMTDIYALGIVLYEMLTGTVPFLGENALTTAVKRLREAPVPPRTHVPGLDPRWEAAILRCLERDPAARFRTAPEVLQALTAPPRADTVTVLQPPPSPTPAAPPRPGARRRKLQIAGLAVLILLSFAAVWVRYTQWRARQTVATEGLVLPPLDNVALRTSVAVLGFKDLSGNPNTAWLSSALAEMLSTELAAGGGVRVAAGENVARAKVELGLGAADSLAGDTLSRLRALLGTDAVVLGSYVVLDEPGGRRIRLDLRLQDTLAGETTATVAETGGERQLFDLVSRVGKRLRRELGVEELAGDAGEVRAALPAGPEAARLYSEGLGRLRLFDPVGARDRLSRAVAAEPGNALSHSALAAAWSALGYDGRAREEAKTAFDLAGNLPREERLLIEGRYREATQDWSRAVRTYWTLWSMFPDSLDHGLRLAAAQTAAGRVEDALATAGALRTLPPPTRDDPRIDLAEATAAGARADFERQRTAAAKAAAKGAAQGAPLMVARARLLECRALRNLGRPDAALAACGEGRKLHAAAGDRSGVAEALTHAANVLYDRGDLPGARRLYEQALETGREIGNRGAEAGALNNIAVVLKSQGDLERARQLYQEVLAISREIGSRGGEAYALNNLAGVLLRRGELDEAARLLGESLQIRREQQDRAGEAYALDNLGVALRRKGDLAGARRRHDEALAIRRRIGQKIGEVTSLNNLGSVLLDQGELSAARRSFASSLALCRQTGNKSASAYALFGLGEVLAREGNAGEARNRHEEALAIRDQLGEKGARAESRLALASVLLEAGDAVRGSDLARDAAVELGQQGATSGEALALAVSAGAAEARGDIAQAQAAIDRATILVQKDQDLRARLSVELAAARLARSREPEQALRSVIDRAARSGLLELRLQAELTLAERAARQDGGAKLVNLEKEARALGYGAIARQAWARKGGAVSP